MAKTVRSSPCRCFEPWNMRCSKRCAKPLRPLRSSTAPTWYQTSTAASGARWSSERITVSPFSSWYFSNGISGSDVAARINGRAASMRTPLVGAAVYPGRDRLANDLVRAGHCRISPAVTTSKRMAKRSSLQKWTFLVLFVLAAYGFWRTLEPVWVPLLLGAVIAVGVYPLHEKLLGKFGGRQAGLSAALLTGAVMVLSLGLLAFLIFVVGHRRPPWRTTTPSPQRRLTRTGFITPAVQVVAKPTSAAATNSGRG